MGFNSNRLVVPATFNNNLGTTGSIYVDPRGMTREEVIQGAMSPPTAEGQLKVFRTDRPDLCNLYFSIEVEEGVFEWKPVQVITSIKDSTTGRDWDPTANYIYSYAR